MSAAQTPPPETTGYITLVRQNEKFRFLWLGQIVSLLGDWFNLIASAALIARLTNSGAAIGGLFVVRMLAPFLMSPFAGVAADRYNRKWLLIITDISRGIVVLGFLLVRTPEDVWLVYALTALQMGISGFFFPTRNAILPDITKRHELGAANALSASTWSVMLAFGAALGGLFSGTVGIYPAFVLDSVTFFISGLVISRIAYTIPAELGESDRTLAMALHQYVEGLRYLRHHADILVISLHKAANALFVAGAYQVAQVAIAENEFRIGEGGGISLGLMYAMVGVGTGVGPIVARYFTGDRDRALRLAIIIGYLFSAVGMGLASTLSSFPVVLAGTLLRGVGVGIAWVFSTQLLLQLVPGNVRGRIFATEFMLFTLMNAIAAGAGGTLLDRLGVDTLLGWLAILTVLPSLLWALWVRFGTRSQPALEASSSPS